VATEYPGCISYRYPDGTIRAVQIRVVIDGPSTCCYMEIDGVEHAFPAETPCVELWMKAVIAGIRGASPQVHELLSAN
jgi:hypothetical protein